MTNWRHLGEQVGHSLIRRPHGGYGCECGWPLSRDGVGLSSDVDEHVRRAIELEDRAARASMAGPAVHGDRIAIVFLPDPGEEQRTTRLDAVLLQFTPFGVWWHPADDAPTPYLTPWHRVIEISREDRR